ncbi:aminotransferase class IV family protein [Streptomyces amakusaensis]|uniref:Aminotransferase class IV n=1 Tax=Streptomyces amakusaensis TaxID=67271 RepID=A0ABW0AB14_9ACTN
MTHTEIDGVVATGAMSMPMLNDYGHFTAMQVRGGRVRGIGLHLARLDGATRELYGQGLDKALVRERMRGALASAGLSDASLRVYTHWPEGDERATLTVTVREPFTRAPKPVRLMSVPYVRDFPHIKHLGSFGQSRALTLAARAGYDEALLVAADGTVTEGAVTNVAFWDGERVVWPDAPSLLGIAQALLEPLLPSVRRRVTLAGLGGYRAAFVTNSRGISPVASVDAVEYDVDEALMASVTSAYDSVPWDEI